MRRDFLKALAGATLLAATKGTARAAEVELQLQLSWGRQAETQRAIAAQYMKAHPGVHIAFQAVTPDYTTGLDTVLRQAAAGQAPDITYQATNLMAQVVDRGLAVDLRPFIAADPDFNNAGYTRKILEMGQVNGVQYAMPFLIGAPVVYYNLDLVRRAGADPAHLPQTWDDLIALAGKIHSPANNTAGMYFSYISDWQFQSLISGLGSDMMDPTRARLAFDGPAGLTALQTIRRFVTAGGMQPMSRAAAEQQFASGTLGILVDVGSLVVSFQKSVGNRFTFQTTKLPNFVGAQSLGVVVGGNAAMILTRDPMKQRAAWDYIRYATGPEGQTFVTKLNAEPPINTLALGPDYLGHFYQENPNFVAELEEVQDGKPWFAFPGNNSAEIVDAISKAQEAVVQQKQTPEAVFAAMISQIKALLPAHT
jgi:multiple sugar transport system substrate-binding protein